jgi:outer membrane protein W
MAWHSARHFEAARRVNDMKKLLAILMLLASTASAQTAKTNDVAVVITSTEFEDPSINDIEGNTVSFDLDEDLGYGISFNHYWTGAFSTEVALHRVGADLSVRLDDDEDPIEAGELEARALSAVAQWHFLRGSRFSPYIGAGVAHIQGSFDGPDDPEEDTSFDFESETTWVANFGADINLTDAFAIVLDGRYMQWEPVAEGEDDEGAVDLNPLMLSAGVRVRF